MRVVATKSTKDNLCDYCFECFASCPKAEHIKFGDGVGNDNVIECSEFLIKGGCEQYVEGRPELGIFRSGRAEKPE